MPLSPPLFRRQLPSSGSLITGTSIGHDIGLEDLIRWDPSLWAILLAGFAVMTVIFAGAIALGHVAMAMRPLNGRGDR
jgi:hypothetical protein